MSRYQALRQCGCGFFVAWFISVLNDLRGVPLGEIRFMTATVEYEQGAKP